MDTLKLPTPAAQETQAERTDERISDVELCSAIANDPFHQSQSQFESLYGNDALELPSDTIWVDPDIAAMVDEVLDVDVDVEHFPSVDSMLLVTTCQEWFEAAAATETLLGAPSPIDVETVEDIRYRYERAPLSYSESAGDVRILIHALDTLERSHLTALVELHRTVLRLKKQLGQ